MVIFDLHHSTKKLFPNMTTTYLICCLPCSVKIFTVENNYPKLNIINVVMVTYFYHIFRTKYLLKFMRIIICGVKTFSFVLLINTCKPVTSSYNIYLYTQLIA